MSTPIISAQNIGKRYRLGATLSPNTLRDHLAEGTRRLFRKENQNGESSKRQNRDFWALKDVNFEIKEGEVVGIIGHNGAGKSTLLKILSQITEPTEGEIRIRGRVASLLEVGTGFHPELSGRENVFMNGAILGMTKAEIRSKFDEIVDFAGVEKFIDTPVKRYSSGMVVRLGFAVAAHLEPEIMVVDEVLAVGDAEFQRKCLGKMEDVSRGGRTILFVSHNMAAVEALCSRGIVLSQGRVKIIADTVEAISAYQDHCDSPRYDLSTKTHPSRTITVRPIVSRFRITSETGETARTLTVGQKAVFEIDFSTEEALRNLVFGIHFYTMLGQRIMTFHSSYQADMATYISDGKFRIACICEEVQLAPGLYRVVLGVAAAGDQIERFDPLTTVNVSGADYYRTGKAPPQTDGVFWPKAMWSPVSSLTN